MPHGQDHVGVFADQLVGDRVAKPSADADAQWVVFGDQSLGHERRRYGCAKQLGQRDHLGCSAGPPRTVAYQDQRKFGLGQRLGRCRSLRLPGPWTGPDQCRIRRFGCPPAAGAACTSQGISIATGPGLPTWAVVNALRSAGAI